VTKPREKPMSVENQGVEPHAGGARYGGVLPPDKRRRYAVAPPQMTILSDHAILREDDKPDDREHDFFMLHSRLGAVYDIIRHKNTRAPLAVAVYGDWGAGKSSAMRWLIDQLDTWNNEDEHGEHFTARSVLPTARAVGSTLPPLRGS